MVGYVRHIIDDASDRDSEDIVQDVMAGIFEAADITRPVENLSAYIYRSLRNRVIDIIRDRKSFARFWEEQGRSSYEEYRKTKEETL